MRLYKKISSKLTEKRGASIVIALLFFLVVVMVSSVVIMAASSNLTRTRERWTEEQAYLTLSSAALYLDEKFKDLNFVAWEARTVYNCKTQAAYDDNLTSPDYDYEGYRDCMNANHIHELTVYEGYAPENDRLAVAGTAASSIDDGLEKLIMSMAYDITRTKTIYNTPLAFSDISDAGSDGYISVSITIAAETDYDMVSDVNAEIRMYEDYSMRIILTLPGYTYSLILSINAASDTLPVATALDQIAYDVKIEDINGYSNAEGTYIDRSEYVYGEQFEVVLHGHTILMREEVQGQGGASQWHEYNEIVYSQVSVYVTDYKVTWSEASITKGVTYTS